MYELSESVSCCFYFLNLFGINLILLSGERICLAMQETQEIGVCSLGWDDPLEEEMATHFSILTWRIQWTEEPGGLQSMGL